MAARGHPRSPAGRRVRAGVRPTAARVRDALFNRLGAQIDGATVLDLFAGTGALGLEALRRGAGQVVFVEVDPRRARAIRLALPRPGPDNRAEVCCEDVLAAVARFGRAGRVFHLIMMDPPYGRRWVPRTLEAIAEAGVLAPGGLIVAEGHWRDRPEVPAGLVVEREARYGETMLWFIRSRAGQ